jgi:hypothetical protein
MHALHVAHMHADTPQQPSPAHREARSNSPLSVAHCCSLVHVAATPALSGAQLTGVGIGVGGTGVGGGVGAGVGGGVGAGLGLGV